MSDVKKLKLPLPELTVAGRFEAAPPSAEPPKAPEQSEVLVAPVPAPMPRQAAAFSKAEVDEMVRDGIADMSKHEFSTPMPPDFQASVDAFSAKNALLTERILETEDGPMEAIVASAVPDIRRVAGPYRAQLAKLADEYKTDGWGNPTGELTKMGYEGRVRAIETQLQSVLAETVFGPLERSLQATEQRYQVFVKVTAPTAEQRLEATAIAAELPHLTPTHALPRVAEVLRDAIKADEFGVVRALLPYLKSQLETKGTAYYGSQDMYAMVKTMEGCLKDFNHAVGAARLQQVNRLKYELNALKQMVTESMGDLNNAFGFSVAAGDGESPNSFIRGKARTAARKAGV